MPHRTDPKKYLDLLYPGPNNGPHVIPTRICALCGQVKKLQEFRRWALQKRALHATCNQCAPEQPLSRLPRAALLNPYERMQNAKTPGTRTPLEPITLRAGTVPEHRIAQELERRKQHKTKANSLATTRQHKLAWKADIAEELADLNKEIARATTSRRSGHPDNMAFWSFYLPYLRLARTRMKNNDKNFLRQQELGDKMSPTRWQDWLTDIEKSILRQHHATRHHEKGVTFKNARILK
jgi:hypothetical protein